VEKVRVKCRIAVFSAVLSGVLICGLIAVYSQALLGTWTMKSSLPANRAEVAAVALTERLHALGGSLDGRAGAYHDEYDPTTDKWHSKAPLPGPRDHLAVAVTNGKIYAFGGFAVDVHKDASNGAFEYDPTADAWRDLPPMKVARGAAGAAMVDGKAHVIGGRGLDGTVVATHEVFDPQSRGWAEAAPLPTARDHMVVIAVDGKIRVSVDAWVALASVPMNMTSTIQRPTSGLQERH